MILNKMISDKMFSSDSSPVGSVDVDRLHSSEFSMIASLRAVQVGM
jgi:hypothetical protein